MVPGIILLFVRNFMKTCLSDLLQMQELTDIISCVLLMHMKNSINNILMMAEAVGVTRIGNRDSHINGTGSRVLSPRSIILWG